MARLGGRKTKLTKAFIKKFTMLLRECPSIQNACDRAAITKKTYYNWINAGNTDEGTKIQKEFAIECRLALADYEASCLNKIVEHGDKSWQAIAWVLERRFKGKYSQHAPEEDNDSNDGDIEDEFK